MLLSTALTVSLVLLSAKPSKGSDPCQPAFTVRFAALKQVFSEAARLRQAAREGETSFTQLVMYAARLQKQASTDLEQIQAVGCGEQEDDVPRLDACISPIQWSCEGIPPSIDWSLLKNVPKSEDEAMAYSLSLPSDGGGVDLLSEDAGFAGGCGDFGCAPESISLPSLLGKPEEVARLVTLASRPGFFGQRALKSLEKLGSTLAKAKCDGGGWHPESPAQQKAVLEHLNAQRAGLTGNSPQSTQVRQALQRLAAALKRGSPKKQCKMPGY